MPFPLRRRSFLLGSVTLPWVTQALCADDSWSTAMAGLERAFDGRLGVHALDTGSGAHLSWRADERFAMCSTFKVLMAAAVLARQNEAPLTLDRHVEYGKTEMVSHSPITEQHLGRGLSVSELCAAGLQYSDNTAGNLLIKRLGGPPAITAFARSLGDDVSRLDRIETALNSALPGDPRDTTSAHAMASNLHVLLLGEHLPAHQRAQLVQWMLGNTTGAGRISAGVPAGWKVADKTGGGDYGTANDIAVIWPPGRAPVILAVYTTRRHATAEPHPQIIAQITRHVVSWLG